MNQKTAKPAAQYLASEEVIREFYQHGERRLTRQSPLQILVLAMMAGGFITMGALFSVLLSQQVETAGWKYLIQGVGFSTGFFFVILSSAVLFTEANVVLPSALIFQHEKSFVFAVLRFWMLALLGNFLGAWTVGWLVHTAQHYPPEVHEGISRFVDKKMHYREIGTTAAWFQAMLSGVLANWLVGMAAFFATMGRTIIGKYIPVLLAVTLFGSANFQHSPANMGYFALMMPEGDGPGWLAATMWNVIPVGIGNMIGGALLVALPFWYALRDTR
jgi:formate/nitrite transporter FocA (FNT family)